MAKNWQYQLEEFSEQELMAKGYTRFGRNFAYEINPQILGVMRFEFHRLFAQKGTQLMLHLGLIHWQLSDLALQITQQPEVWTAHFPTQMFGLVPKPIILKKDENISEQCDLIRKLVSDIDIEAVPRIKTKFSTLQAICDYLEKADIRRFCIAKAMLVEQSAAIKALERMLLANQSEAANVIAKNFGEWLSEDAQTPDLQTSRAKIFALAQKRVEVLKECPRNIMPGGHW